MRANRAYHLTVSRQGLEPAFLSGPERLDRIEVVSIDDGEAILYWAGLEAGDFIERWGGTDVDTE